MPTRFPMQALESRVDAVQELAQIRGLSDAKVEKLLEAAKKMCSSGNWQSAAEVERQVCCHQSSHFASQTIVTVDCLHTIVALKLELD